MKLLTALILTFSSLVANATIGISCEVDDASTQTGFYVDTYYPTGNETYSPRVHTLWFNGEELVSLDKQNSKVALVMKEVACENFESCIIYAKLDLNGNGKYEGEFVVKYSEALSLALGEEEGGAVYSGTFINYTKKDKNLVTKSSARCLISN